MTDISFSRLPDPVNSPEIYDHTPTKRALAWLVDLAVIGGATTLVVMVTMLTALLVLPFVWLAIGFAYRAVTIARGSATWGMRLLAVELRNRRGGRLEPVEAVAHTAVYYAAMAVAPLQILSAALMLTTPRRMGLGDHLLGTAAVNALE